MSRPFSKRIYLLFIGIISLQSVCFGLSDAYHKFIDSNSDEFVVVAHRGDWRSYPENSLSGIQSCIDHGVDVLEIDVGVTSDGVPILMHDSTVNRTTDGNGSVSGLTLAQIKSFTLDGTANEKVPTLEEAVLLMKDQCMFYLDKEDNSTVIAATMEVLESTDTVFEGMFRSTGTAQQVIDRFAAAGITDLSTIHVAFKITCSGTTSPSMETIMDELAVFEPNRPELLQVNYNNAGHPIFDAENVSAIREGGSRFFVNTMWDGRVHRDPSPGAEPTDWDWVLDHGINSAQTDRPLWMVPYVNGYAYYESPVDGTSSASTYPSLSWMRAWNVDHHNVYLGTSMAAVSNATPASPEFKGAQASPYSPGVLVDGQTYYWRVDEMLNDGSSNPGTVWSFTTASIPPSGSTLYLHLTADDLILADGAAVTTWTDSVGSNVFTGAATYEADYTNGHAAVLFNGSNDVLRITNLAGPDTASVTLFVVGNFISGLASTDYMVTGQNYEPTWGGNASGDNRLRLAVAATDWRTRIGDGSNIDSGGNADTDSHIFSIVSGQGGTSSVKMLVDGSQVLSGTHGTTANCLDLSAVNLGAYYGRASEAPSGADNANCYIAEVRVYDGAMTDFEIATINQELHDKYFTAQSPDPVGDASISGPISGGTAMEISWTGTLGFTYGVETNSDLIDGSWYSLTNNIPGIDGLTTITNIIIDLNQLFYRVIREDA